MLCQCKKCHDTISLSQIYAITNGYCQLQESSILTPFKNVMKIVNRNILFNSFAFQGNSNSISTVDVSAGYIGLEDYQPVLIGILMALSTYSGPIFWTISLIKILIEIRCLHPSDKQVSLQEVTNPVKCSQHQDKNSSKIMNIHRSKKEDEDQKVVTF